MQQISVAYTPDVDRSTKTRLNTRYKKIRDAMVKHMEKPHQRPLPRKLAVKLNLQDFFTLTQSTTRVLLKWTKKRNKKTILGGRRSAISMQLFDCNTCFCCGWTNPFINNPLFPSDTGCPFPPHHLVGTYHPA